VLRRVAQGKLLCCQGRDGRDKTLLIDIPTLVKEGAIIFSRREIIFDHRPVIPRQQYTAVLLCKRLYAPLPLRESSEKTSAFVEKM